MSEWALGIVLTAAAGFFAWMAADAAVDFWRLKRARIRAWDEHADREIAAHDEAAALCSAAERSEERNGKQNGDCRCGKH